jgi:hypothetical protein
VIAYANRVPEAEPPALDNVPLDALVRSLAHRVLAQAVLQDGGEGYRVTLADGPYRLVVALWREDEPQRRPSTECEADLLAVLRDARGRLTTMRVLDELDRRDMLHGEATVKRALARMVKDGVLVSNKRSPRGYLLAERVRPV